MTEQKTKQRTNQIPTDQVDKDDWSAILSQIRNHNEKAKITNWQINGETAVVEYQVDGFENYIFTQEIDATLHPRKKSEFEQFLEHHGYTPHEPDALTGETIDIRINRTETGVQFEIPINPNRKDSYKHVSIVTAASLLVGLLPIFNIAILATIIKDAREPTKSFHGEELAGAIGITTGCILTYVVAPIIYYLVL